MEIENNFENQVVELLKKEKKARSDNDHITLSEIVVSIVKLALDMKKYSRHNELITFLAKRRGQHKKGMSEMVKLSFSYIDKIEDVQTRLLHVNAIKDVCEKKIFLEVEYARCALLLVKHNETEDNIKEAADLLSGIQVETYGSMDRREKVEFILYQMRIMIKMNDQIRLNMVSKKINRKNIETVGLEDLKIKFFAYLINNGNYKNEYHEVSKCYKTIYDTLTDELQQKTKMDFGFSLDRAGLLENLILYLAISPHSLEREQQLLSIQKEYALTLEKYPHLQSLVNKFLTLELISTDIKNYNVLNCTMFNKPIENYQKHVEEFSRQLVQHNLRVIHKYYSQISLQRISELLGVPQDLAETELCEMIFNKIVYARIDRLTGIVNFLPKKNENETLNEWTFDVHKLLTLVDSTCNLINREYEVHGVK